MPGLGSVGTFVIPRGARSHRIIAPYPTLQSAQTTFPTDWFDIESPGWTDLLVTARLDDVVDPGLIQIKIWLEGTTDDPETVADPNNWKSWQVPFDSMQSHILGPAAPNVPQFDEPPTLNKVHIVDMPATDLLVAEATFQHRLALYRRIPFRWVRLDSAGIFPAGDGWRGSVSFSGNVGRR